jgi:hypothetical protein
LSIWLSLAAVVAVLVQVAAAMQVVIVHRFQVQLQVAVHQQNPF